MKKRFDWFVTLLLVTCMIFCFVGCKEPEPEPEPEGPIIENLMNPGADTILFLDKPQVKVTAYPGMNYVSWMPVTNAKSYILYVYAGDNYVYSKNFDYNEELYYIDTDIKNNVKYTYIVEAESASSPGRIENSDVNIITSRAVYTQNSKSDGVSVIAIVPEYDTSALELVDYENPAGNTSYIVNSENLHIARHNNNKLSVSLPGKAYLCYDVFLTVGDKYEILNSVNNECELNDVSQNDVTLYTDFTVTQAGKYNARVVVRSINSHFGDSDVITSSQSVTVEALNGSGGEIVSAEYKDFGDAIRVIFDKFELENGSDAPISYYKLYRSEKGSSVYTQVSNKIKPTGDTTDEYFVDDSSIDNTKDYVYTLVVTDGNLYKEDPSTRVVTEYVKRPQSEISVYGRVISEDSIEWTVTIPAGVQFDGLYKLVKPVDYTTDIIPADFDRSKNEYNLKTSHSAIYTDTNTDAVTYTYKTSGHRIGEKVYLLVLTSQTNKLSRELISDPVSMVETRTAYFNIMNTSTELLDPIVAIDDGGYSWNQIRLPEIPERDGYNADVYWCDSYGDIYYEGEYVYLEHASITFSTSYNRTASFTDVTNSISVPSIVVIESNDSYWNDIQLPSVPRREGEGYNTDGYWYDSNGNFYNEGSSVSLDSASTTYTAKYYRTASFKDEDGDNIVDKIKVTETNNYNWNRVQLPSIPSREGYISDGYWYDSNGNSYYEGYYVSLYDASATFYARYIESLSMYSYNLLYLDSDSQYYSFSCNSGSTYTVSCLDSYDGNTELTQLMSENSVLGSTVDIRVSIISADGSQTVLTGEDNGSCTFTANTTGTYYVIVEPYSSGSTGYFAVCVE